MLKSNLSKWLAFYLTKLDYFNSIFNISPDGLPTAADKTVKYFIIIQIRVISIQLRPTEVFCMLVGTIVINENLIGFLLISIVVKYLVNGQIYH